MYFSYKVHTLPTNIHSYLNEREEKIKKNKEQENGPMRRGGRKKGKKKRLSSEELFYYLRAWVNIRWVFYFKRLTQYAGTFRGLNSRAESP